MNLNSAPFRYNKGRRGCSSVCPPGFWVRAHTERISARRKLRCDMASNHIDPGACISVLVNAFYQYAGKKAFYQFARKRRLNRKEFQKMGTEDSEKVNEFFTIYDANKDSKISFEEYWSLISSIAITQSDQMAMQSEVRPSNAQVSRITDVERSINSIVRYFYEHSTVQGNTKTVTIEEFKTMLEADFLDCIKEYSDPGQVLKDLDSESQEVEFSEYWKIIERFANDLKKEAKKKR
ncbi:uncharacterized protein LOC144797646 isoform X2 [Lissotriton helveticus]